LDQFADWFARCRKTLHYMADLILNNSEMAEHAVQNCRLKASRDLPGFESEGEFRGWIFRLLINEALKISPGRLWPVAESSLPMWGLRSHDSD
jgi:DNA-directed RNA polymerase specialized sigma24 family protein